MKKSMKRAWIGALAGGMLSAILLCGCGEDGGKKYTVSFDTDGGSEITSQKVVKKGVASYPDAPEKAGYKFLYWSLDGVEEYDFSTPVEGDVVLIAVYAPYASSAYTVNYYDAATQEKIGSETFHNGIVDETIEFIPLDLYGANGKYYVFDADNAGNALKKKIAADGSAAFSAYYNYNELYTQFAVEDMLGFGLTEGANTLASEAVLTLSANKLNVLQTRETGNAFVASMDFTYLGNASDNGAGFSVEDGEGNVLNFMFVDWTGSKLCVQYGNENGNRYNDAAYFSSEPLAADTKVNLSLLYNGETFGIYENGKIRNLITLAEIGARIPAANGKFTADEPLRVGLYGYNGGNTNGKIEKLDVEFSDKATVNGSYTSTLEYQLPDGTPFKTYGATIAAAPAGSEITMTAPAYLEYEGVWYLGDDANSTLTQTLGANTKFVAKFKDSDFLNDFAVDQNKGFTIQNLSTDNPTLALASGNTQYALYTRESGNAFKASAQYTYIGQSSGATWNDTGAGFTVQDSDGHTLILMLVNWGDCKLAVQYGADRNGYNGGRWTGVTTASSVAPGNNVAVNVELTYANGVFTLWENGKLRNLFTMDEVMANIPAANGAFTADEELFVGVAGVRERNTNGAFDDLAVEFVTDEAQKTAFNEFYNTYGAVKGFTVTPASGSYSPVGATFALASGNRQYAMRTKAMGNAFVAKADFTYLGNSSDNGAGFSVQDADGNSINFMLVNWTDGKLAIQYSSAFGGANNGRWSVPTVCDYAALDANTKVSLTLTYADGAFALWEGDKLRNAFTINDVMSKIANANGKFTATESFRVGIFGASENNTNGKFENLSVEFVTDEAKKAEMSEIATAQGFSVTKGANSYALADMSFTLKLSTTHRMYTTTSGNKFTANVRFAMGGNDTGSGFSVRDTDGNTIDFMIVSWSGNGYLAVRYNGGSPHQTIALATGGAATEPVYTGVTVDFKLEYEAGTFKLYEVASGVPTIRNQFTLADITANTGITAGENLQVGLWGLPHHANTKGTFTSFTYEFAAAQN